MSWRIIVLERSMGPSTREGIEQFLERGWAKVMEMLIKKKKKTRSLRIMSLEFDVIDGMVTEDMQIVAHVINLLMN
jgi:hypothetical protein